MRLDVASWETRWRWTLKYHVLKLTIQSWLHITRYFMRSQRNYQMIIKYLQAIISHRWMHKAAMSSHVKSWKKETRRDTAQAIANSKERERWEVLSSLQLKLNTKHTESRCLCFFCLQYIVLHFHFRREKQQKKKKLLCACDLSSAAAN